MLGYGDTDKPCNVEEYTTKRLCADLAALLDFIGVERAVSTLPRQFMLSFLLTWI
jgi:soluble epoxide hydrolase/lipid-phosphate phosphatase